ncbi:MAG: hypothetical protein GXY06_07675 [Clostridiaceae bacterium]|nr:hypothetical protein [Clostridiaceae bacterium]
MANRIVDENGLYVFDQDHTSEGKIDQPSILDIIMAFVGNRYFILAVIFSVFGLAIFFKTSVLQFQGTSYLVTTAEKGVPRQYNVPAPRGNIYDSNGVALASTQEVNTLLIANSGMFEDDFNAMLLELSYLFDEYNVTTISGLDQYYSAEPFEFLKDEDELILWQTGKNLFILKEPAPGIVVTYNDDYVKLDPQVFFLYLRDLFKIDGAYTTDEAYRIIRLRYQIFTDNWGFQNGNPVAIATDVSPALIQILLEQNFKYQGIIASKDYRRIYSPLAKYSSHVVGYLGKISEERLAELKDIGYTPTDLVGQSGIEAQMERYLHGTQGKQPYNIWSSSAESGAFYAEDMGIQPVPGADVYLTIRSDLQQAGLEAMKEYIEEAANSPKKVPGYKTANAGAFVVLDVKTGAILGMGSYPDYDPNDFILAMEGDAQANEQIKYYLGIDGYEKITETDKPLFNRAISGLYAPGSTYKMVTALAALKNGVITPSNSWETCDSPSIVGGWKFKCLSRPNGGHGPLRLGDAMATSCNIYFQKIGHDTGINELDAMGKLLGLGELSGVDLPGEMSGIRSNRETKKLLREDEYDRKWMPADTAQSAIGQFDHLYTIIQLARYTAAVATNNLVTPHVISEVVAEDGTILYSGNTDVIPLGINEADLKLVQDGMKQVVDSEQGTIYKYVSLRLFSGQIPLAAKTGTAETGWEEIRKEYSNGLFVCYAPADDPQIAIALVVERGEWGSSTAVIAEELLRVYFDLPIETSVGSEESTPVLGDYYVNGG